jgi:hypothetical protein
MWRPTVNILNIDQHHCCEKVSHLIISGVDPGTDRFCQEPDGNQGSFPGNERSSIHMGRCLVYIVSSTAHLQFDHQRLVIIWVGSAPIVV